MSKVVWLQEQFGEVRWSHHQDRQTSVCLTRLRVDLVTAVWSALIPSEHKKQNADICWHQTVPAAPVESRFTAIRLSGLAGNNILVNLTCSVEGSYPQPTIRIIRSTSWNTLWVSLWQIYTSEGAQGLSMSLKSQTTESFQFVSN